MTRASAALQLAVHFIRRDLRSRYLGSFSGGVWALGQPLLQLAIYSFVFVEVFKARLPGADTQGFVPFLALALWPWVALSDGILRATPALIENAALIGKVALPRVLLVAASCAASFLVHLVGFVAVVLVLWASGVGIDIAGLPLALAGFVMLFAFALGLALLCAALQVFVRDLAQALGQLMTLWMFASPIFYTAAMLPERYRVVMDYNPFSFYANFFRSVLLGQEGPGPMAILAALLIAATALGLGYAIFRRLDAHFEDFL